MPIYVYQAKADGCPHCRQGFEELQGLGDKPLDRCPRCGKTVARVFAGFATAKGNILTDGNLRRHGFQKLRRADDGRYRPEG